MFSRSGLLELLPPSRGLLDALKGVRMTTYRQAADAGFKTLMTLWDHGRVFDASNGGCFWMGGNTFHVAVEYLSLTNQKDTYNLAVDALDLFDRKVTDQDPLHWIKDDI